MDFKDRFHELRKAHKMTLEDVGNSLGLTKATVQKWELGSISNIKLEHIEKLSNLFDCTKAYLMG
jgi:transcriptional regulator with XRE-family HTH domain